MDITTFLKSTKSEPFPDEFYGDGYRCSVRLKDGLFLPCVIIRTGDKITELAVRRFNEERTGKSIFKNNNNGYKDIVRTFVAGGNKINSYDIASVEESEYAMPLSLLEKLEGETMMSWTGFVLEMKDGKKFSYGTSFCVYFFELPDGYSFDDVERIHNHSLVDKSGEVVDIRGLYDVWDCYKDLRTYKSRPYFECFVDL